MVEDSDKVQLVSHDGVDFELEYKVVKWCKLVERIVDDGDLEERIPLKDVKNVTFIKGLGEEELFEVVLASNYLECQHLLELSSAKVATLIQHMDVDQVREFFAIENDFTPEEMERVKQEIKWAEATFQ